jgi:putative CocE/NonD family hydrolase
LATDIYRPKGNEKVPIVFSRTPYNFNTWGNGEMNTRTMETALSWIKKGYAYVVQNERGRYFSEGEWDILGTPLTDGYDAVDWMAKQAWSNGKVGTLGCSSTAEWQMAVASLDHPALVALVPQGFGAGVGTEVALDKCFSPIGCIVYSMIPWRQSFLRESSKRIY